MLGKTNITTLTEGAVVTEIEDYKWVQMQSGVYGNFVKAVCTDDYLAAITADGTVAYSPDGEVWQASTLEYEDCVLRDIYWDGKRFIIVGSYKFADTDTNKDYQRGLILTTVDFTVYEKVEIPGSFSLGEEGRGDWISEYLGIYVENSKYYAMGIRDVMSITNNQLGKKIYICRFIGDLENTWEFLIIRELKNLDPLFAVACNSSKFIISYSGSYSSSSSTYTTNEICVITSDRKKDIEVKNMNYNLRTPVFECKNELYYMRLYSDADYMLAKVTDSDEKVILSQNINYRFVDGIYFNNCLIFINSHEMLIVKKGESIVDKTLDDLIEIAPELTMNCITKAFGQLYIFGNQGAILKSSVETNNEEAVTVQTLSARKALADAKQYTDEKYAALEARIAVLESALKTE